MINIIMIKILCSKPLLWYALSLYHIHLTHKQHAFELHGFTFFNSKYYSTVQSVVGWILGCGTVNTEEPHLQKANYKLYVNFLWCIGLVLQPPCHSKVNCNSIRCLLEHSLYYVLQLGFKFMFCGLIHLESIIGRAKHLNSVCVGKPGKWSRLIFPQFVWLIWK